MLKKWLLLFFISLISISSDLMPAAAAAAARTDPACVAKAAADKKRRIEARLRQAGPAMESQAARLAALDELNDRQETEEAILAHVAGEQAAAHAEASESKELREEAIIFPESVPPAPPAPLDLAHESKAIKEDDSDEEITLELSRSQASRKFSKKQCMCSELIRTMIEGDKEEPTIPLIEDSLYGFTLLDLQKIFDVVVPKALTSHKKIKENIDNYLSTMSQGLILKLLQAENYLDIKLLQERLIIKLQRQVCNEPIDDKFCMTLNTLGLRVRQEIMRAIIFAHGTIFHSEFAKRKEITEVEMPLVRRFDCDAGGARLEGHIFWLPSGLLVTQSSRGTVKVWNSVGKEPLRVYENIDALPSSCGQLATQGDDTYRSTIKVLDIDTGEKQNFEVRPCLTNSRPRISNDKRYIAYITSLKEHQGLGLLVFDMVTGKIASIALKDDWNVSVTDINWSPDGKSIVCYGQSKYDENFKVVIFNFVDGRLIMGQRFASESRGVDYRLKWSPTSDYIAYRDGVGEANFLVLANVITGETRRINIPRVYIRDMSFSPDGQFIALNFQNENNLHIYSTFTGALLKKFELFSVERSLFLDGDIAWGPHNLVAWYVGINGRRQNSGMDMAIFDLNPFIRSYTKYTDTLSKDPQNILKMIPNLIPSRSKVVESQKKLFAAKNITRAAIGIAALAIGVAAAMKYLRGSRKK